MSDLDGAAGLRDVLIECLSRGIEHHRGEPALDRGNHLIGRGAVVPVDRGGNRRTVQPFADRAEGIEAEEVDLVRVNGDDHRRVLLLADLDESVEHVVIRDVERRDREAVLVGDVEQVVSGNEHWIFSFEGVVFRQLLTDPAVRPPMK